MQLLCADVDQPLIERRGRAVYIPCAENRRRGTGKNTTDLQLYLLNRVGKRVARDIDGEGMLTASMRERHRREVWMENQEWLNLRVFIFLSSTMITKYGRLRGRYRTTSLFWML